MARSSRCARVRTTNYYVFDALGSVIALTDGSGAIAASYTYDPFGTTLTASGAQASVNPFRFASGYYDSATGLTKFGDRYYDPSLGRWTQRDPIGGSIASPGAVDRYVYVGDSPVNMTDESGALSVNGSSICFNNTEVGLFLVRAAMAGPAALASAIDLFATVTAGPVGTAVVGALLLLGLPTLSQLPLHVLGAATSGRGISIGITVVGIVPFITPGFC